MRACSTRNGCASKRWQGRITGPCRVGSGCPTAMTAAGSFSWTQQGDHYVFVLRAPITGKSFRLSGGPDGALLEGLDGGPLQGPDAEALMRKALGWEVPL